MQVEQYFGKYHVFNKDRQKGLNLKVIIHNIKLKIMPPENGDNRGNTDEGEKEKGKNSGRGLSIRQLDDYVAAGIIVFYGVVVIMIINGTWTWDNLPESLQYWVTNALVLALGVLFGKGAYRFRQRRQNM